MKNSEFESIRNWDTVFECLDRIVSDPAGNKELTKAVTVNLRVETGSLPGYRGTGFADKADSIGLSKQMRKKLESLMTVDLSSDDMYLLVRQLVKSLPFFGASQDEIRTIRGLAEEIEYGFPCPITEDIRGEIHSKLSPRNLDFVRALLSHIENNEHGPLERINKYQKVIQYKPEKFYGILEPLRELEIELANVFEPHPGKIEDRISDIYQLLRNISQIVSPQINDYLRYLVDSMQKNNKSLIQTNLEILLSLIDETIEGEESPDFKPLYQDLKEKIDGIEDRRPEEALELINSWRRKVVSLFLPSLFDLLDEFVDYLRAPDTLKAALMLGEVRMSLRRRIISPTLPPQVRLETIWLDLTLERIGYVVFGNTCNVILEDISTEALPTAIDTMYSMALSVRAKGQGTPKLEEYSKKLLALKRLSELNFYNVYSIVERINTEIGAITDRIVETYYETTRKVFLKRNIADPEQAASAFVDGLFRQTTLQHLSEFTLKLLNFSRARIAHIMKHVRHPQIREISPQKVARIKRDLADLASSTDSSKLAYSFNSGTAEGCADFYPILGEKGAFLAEMSRIGINVPPGFTLTSKASNMFFSEGHVLGDKTRGFLSECLQKLESITGCRLGSRQKPLLLAVRAGSCVSMPGMMDTILNIGLNNDTIEGLSRKTGNPLFAHECYLRLIAKYASSVLGLPDIQEKIIGKDYPAISSLSEMQETISLLLAEILEATGNPFPRDPWEQLVGALSAIFSSWQSDSAIMYRQIFNIPNEFGTAASIQQMVFGNLSRDSCSGVVFSRNPITGDRRIFGEYLPGSQGEVLVCGGGSPLPVAAEQEDSMASFSLEHRLPHIYNQLEEVARRLEVHFRDIQDIEFTVEADTLYFLQTRLAKRTDYAALKIAVDLAEEGITDRSTAVSRLDEMGLRHLFLPIFDPSEPKKLIAKGNPASPGVASGRLAFDHENAIIRAQAGEQLILAANQTTPEDIGGIMASEGVLTREGGMTSHAAINSRRMAKPCITGCQTLTIDKAAKMLRVDSIELGQDDFISIDGYSGEIFLGKVSIIEPEHSAEKLKSADSEIKKYYDTYLAWKEEVQGDTGT